MANRSFVVSRAESGNTVAAVLKRRARLSWPRVQQLVRQRRVRLDGKLCPHPTRPVMAGQRLEVREPSRQKGLEPSPQRKNIVIRFADAHLVVVDKPAGLTTMRHPEEAAEFGKRGQRFLPPTLADLLPGLLAPGKGGPRPRVRPVHRLDKETTGLVVFARTVEAERHLGRQFRAHTVERRYLALVRGRATSGRIESFLVRDRGDGRRGSASEPGTGQRAVTHVRVVEELDGYTLVECRLETGRTHQVCIHLGEQGTALCGERVYDRPVHGKPLPDDSGFARPALHAAFLGFEHPATGERVSWTSPLPRDFQDFLKRIR
jgi:23S rRNA pseudouridine1911/1915/1917 synthase